MRSLANLMDLRGRVAVVTGGAGHIGSAIADALAELGATLAIIDQTSEGCSRVADQLRSAYGTTVAPLVVDLASETEVLAVPDRVKKEFGRMDILIHCAALVGTSDLKGWAVPFQKQGVEAWRKALEINQTVPFLLTQRSAELLAESGHGSVINIASIYGMVGPDPRLYEGTEMGSPAAYAASKGALLQLTRWLATTLAPTVRVNAISPGGVWRSQPEAFVARYLSRTPLGRMAREEDLKGAAAYLASDLSSYVTGQNLVVDGGWTVW